MNRVIPLLMTSFVGKGVDSTKAFWGDVRLTTATELLSISSVSCASCVELSKTTRSSSTERMVNLAASSDTSDTEPLLVV